jgi:hypothetical protein
VGTDPQGLIAPSERRLGRHTSRGYRRHMSTQYFAPAEKIRIGAGTALKFGFFAAFGIFLFYLILSVVLGALALLLTASGFNITSLLPG